MPWEKIKKSKTKQSARVLLLGGSIYDDSSGTIRICNRRRRGGSRSLTKHELHLEEHLWQEDFRVITEFFQRNKVQIWRCFPTRFHSNRNETLKMIEEFFRNDNGESEQIFIIFWCGHGMPRTGDWGFSTGGDITCSDMINTWRSSSACSNENYLTIIADTCYSGAWIPILANANLVRFSYQAASRADESAFILNDGHRPRSLLMRKFIIEQSHSIGCYPWTCVNQNPVHFSDHGETEFGQDLTDGQRTTPIHGGLLVFFTVDYHWTSSGKILTKERQKELDSLIKHGGFIGDL